MEINTKSLYVALRKESIYALNSKSRNLVYETYGKAKMARELGVITSEEFMDLNGMLVRGGINNPKAGLE